MNMEACRKFKNNVALSLAGLMAVCLVIGHLFPTVALAQEDPEHAIRETVQTVSPEVAKFAVVAAAFAFAFGALGAGIAIAYVGSSAVAAVGEKPEIAGQALIFVALAEGIVVFGFITALMILGKV